MSGGRVIDNMKELQEYVNQRHPEANAKDFVKPDLGGPRNKYEERQFREGEYYRKINEDIANKRCEYRENAESSKAYDQQARNEVENMNRKYEESYRDNKLRENKYKKLTDRYRSERAAEYNQRQQQ